MIKKLITLAIAALLAGISGQSLACTTLFISNDNGSFAGFNLDYSNPFPKAWIVPASHDRFARFCFGFDENYRIAEGGMNEKGLFIAVNALNEDAGWKPDPELPDWEEWRGWFETGGA